MNYLDWDIVQTYLPEDLEASARFWGAFERARVLPNAATLLRLVLLYACTPLSFRSVVRWASAADIASFSDVALIERMERCLDWLQHMVNQLLVQEIPRVASQRAIELLDASILPGPEGFWRLHLSYAPEQQAIKQLRLTPQSTGETLKNFVATPGTLYIADRGYGHLKTAAPFIADGAHLLCRVKGSIYLKYAKATGVTEHTVEGGRIIIAPIPTDKRFKSQEKLAARAKRKGQKLRKTTQQTADYLFLFCSDATIPAEEAVALYRLRWQVELVFKRLKSLQQIHKSRLKSQTLYQIEIWGQLLVSLVIEQMQRAKRSLFPPEAVAASVCLAILAIPPGTGLPGTLPTGN